jgi:hypothetical protein
VIIIIIIIIIIIMSRDIVGDVVTKLQAEDLEFESRHVQDFLSSPEPSDRLWGPPSLLFNGKRCYFSGLKRPGCVVDHSLSSNGEVKNESS